MANLAASKQDAESDCEIKRSTTLAQIGRCKVDGDATSGPGVASCTNSGTYALSRLSYCRIRQPHNPRSGNAWGNINLNLNGDSFNANERSRGD